MFKYANKRKHENLQYVAPKYSCRKLYISPENLRGSSSFFYIDEHMLFDLT